MSKKDKDIKKINKKIKTEKVVKKDFEDLYKRALADYQNLQKISAKEKDEFAKYAKVSVLMEILPVYENLISAVSYAGDDSNDQWVTGVKYVIKQFEDILANHGISMINPDGVEFDPSEHEAIEEISTKDKKQVGRVAKVIKIGYKMQDRVLQVAKVAVYK